MDRDAGNGIIAGTFVVALLLLILVPKMVEHGRRWRAGSKIRRTSRAMLRHEDYAEFDRTGTGSFV